MTASTSCKTHDSGLRRSPGETRPEDARILLIYDHALTVRTVKALLAKDGYAAIRRTTDPEAAEQLFADLQPDIVRLALSMPQRDGLPVLSTLRQRAAQHC